VFWQLQRIYGVLPMTNKLVIIGSTGSIGMQALEVCDNLKIQVVGLGAGSNISRLEEQARKYKPSIVSVMDPESGKKLKTRLRDTSTKVVWGLEGMLELVTLPDADTVLTSVVGIAGLLPTLEAIYAKKNIALANKETLVAAGKLVMEAARENGVQILPVDSEHSALFQCLAGNNPGDVEKLILTASGGPFRGFTMKQLEDVTLEQALQHPNWNMGKKITIDSATMMNKGLEVIEAKWLFNIKASRIEILIHPQSMIHSMVLYKDGSIIAQLGAPDMKIPIQLALTWPERKENPFSRTDLTKTNGLTFEKPDPEVFRCIDYAYRAAETGGSMPVVLNGANEVAVSLFLEEKIPFTGIMDLIEQVIENHTLQPEPTIEEIIAADLWSREETIKLYQKMKSNTTK
jgi:1-deoxy-D-xylulose-5-phosphate reductoisomerase